MSFPVLSHEHLEETGLRAKPTHWCLFMPSERLSRGLGDLTVIQAMECGVIHVGRRPVCMKLHLAVEKDLNGEK